MDPGIVSTGAVGGVSTLAIVTTLVAIYRVINHKRIRSSCCGKKISASVDIEDTTPPTTIAPLKAPTSP
jgi:hypothetical protein